MADVSDPNSVVSTIPQSPPPTPNISPSKIPWDFMSMVGVPILFGYVASYLVVWENLRRIGKKDKANKYLIVFGVVVLLGIIFFQYLSGLKRLNGSMVNGFGLLFPIWFYAYYFKEWQKQNPGVAKFQWSVLVWGLFGLVAGIILNVIIGALVCTVLKSC